MTTSCPASLARRNDKVAPLVAGRQFDFPNTKAGVESRYVSGT
jgi:hypothetical protein